MGPVELNPPTPVAGESDNVDVGEVVAGLGFSGGEANLDATGIGEVVGRSGHIAVVLGCPCDAHFVEQGSAAVVAVRILGEDEDGESFLGSLVLDGGEVKLNHGHGLADEVFGVDFFAFRHQVGKRKGFRCECSEVCHDFSSAVRVAGH